MGRFEYQYCFTWPVPAAGRSNACVCGRWPAETVGLKPDGGKSVCLLRLLCVVRDRTLRLAVAQWVEVLGYKPEDRGFDSLLFHFEFFVRITLESIQPLKEMSTKEYIWRGKGGRCVGLKTLQPSCADSLEMWDPQPPGNP
jgi:hypothetical protein